MSRQGAVRTEESGTRRPRLEDIAALAQVSPPTVSKVLNEHAGISAATRLRVQQAIDELGYVRRTPRAPRTPRPQRSIQVMLDRLGTPYAMEILAGISLEAEAQGVDMVVSRFQLEDPETGVLEPSEWAQRLSLAGRTGAIVVTADLSVEHAVQLAQKHLPVVAIDPMDVTGDSVVSIGSTNWAGGYSATEHLLGLGHRRIGVIAGPSGARVARERVHGFRAACESAGVAVDPRFVEHTGWDYASGLAVASEWLAGDDAPTAIFSACDLQALGVLEAARRAGVDVPGDLSVVAYDDTEAAQWAAPPLTAVRQPLHEMGRLALRDLLEVAARPGLRARHVEVATTLVVRDSTAAPRQI
ncbi:LacI family transcriptional regulator [Serinibacter arcticus]|uniref:LacI family transcriptional regulator n=1 Tax=Serinibacter arcticus TaxID=1655435 RepID=A0A2U1ZW82_9MICO|nr:LacI family DNA-binding transcriptional regulator [Serinibacter arcticus]PWD51200.1 LacI family transcriptional regulator [Serinibacter arcticus]